MFIKHLKWMLLLVFSGSIFNLFRYVECQSVLPSQVEQVNLLTKVHELFEQVKQSAKVEQTAMDKSMEADLKLMNKIASLSISTLEELTLIKLTSRSNAVCAFDAKEKIQDITKETFSKLEYCAKTGSEALTINSLHLTNVTEFAVKTGEDFLDKLNDCSTKRGLGVIACYKKIIQNDVVPAKTTLSEAIEKHQNICVKAFAIKSAFNQCTEEIVDSLKYQLDLALEAGLNCT